MVRTREHHIWKLRASDQPSGRPFLWFRTREVLVWKLLAAAVRPSRRQDTTVWTRLKTGKNFSEIFEKPIAQLSVWMPYYYRPDGA
jgi:hypothetical protein